MRVIKIYGWDIPVKKQKGLALNTGMMGFYDYVTKEITLDAGLTKDDLASTLLHEVIHAIFHRAGLHQAKLPEQLEEIIAEQVSTIFAENFRFSQKQKR